MATSDDRAQVPSCPWLWPLQIVSEVWGRRWRDFAYLLPQALLSPLFCPHYTSEIGRCLSRKPGWTERPMLKVSGLVELLGVVSGWTGVKRA